MSVIKNVFLKLNEKTKDIVLCTLSNFYIRGLAGRIPTNELVNRIYVFCELYSGKSLFPYQTQFSRRVIRSVIENDGDEITALFSRQSGKTETISVTSGGLMIILPLLANMPMFANDNRLSMFVDGFWIGIFAPNQRQAGITFNRIRSQLLSKSSIAILESPEFNLTFTTSNGTNVALSNGSHVMAISASEGSNIEGESCMLIICEECLIAGTPILSDKGYIPVEDIIVGDIVISYNHATNKLEPQKVCKTWSKSIVNRKLVKVYTKSGKLVCTDNHRVYVKDRGYIRADSLQIGDVVLSYNHTNQIGGIYDETKSNDTRYFARRWKYFISNKRFKKSKIGISTVCKEFRLFIAKVFKNKKLLQYSAKKCKKSRKGRGYDSITNKMLTPIFGIPQNVLCWFKKSSSFKYIRKDERGSSRLLVLRRWFNKWNDGNTYRSIFSRGKRNTDILVKENVGTIFDKNCNGQKNQQTIFNVQRGFKKQISKNDTSICARIFKVQDIYNRFLGKMLCMWKRCVGKEYPTQDSFLFRRMSKNSPQRILQGIFKENEIEKIEIIPVEECVVYDICVDKNHNFFAGDILVHNCQDISNFKIQKSIMPMGAAYNASIVKIGTSTNFKGDFYDTIQRNKVYDLKCNSYTRRHFEFDCDVASKYNPKYAKYVEKQKQSLGEKSDAFRMAYKLEWIFERGMFVDILDFELNNVDTSLGFVEYDKDSTYIAGIDLGGKNDSTVVAMIQVNHDFPLVLESRVNEDGEEVWYETFNTYLMGFLELKNMPNFEEQYPIILDYLYKFNVLRVVCDATRESAVSHRLAANLPYEVIPYVMTPKSKSDVYKNFETEIVTRRFSVAGDNSTKQTSEYKDFIGQLGELQKGWNGTNMVVSHPTERNAHDDFPDAVALGVWGAMTRAIPNTAETGNNVFFNQRTKNEIKSLVGRNKLTAKRRM